MSDNTVTETRSTVTETLSAFVTAFLSIFGLGGEAPAQTATGTPDQGALAQEERARRANEARATQLEAVDTALGGLTTAIELVTEPLLATAAAGPTAALTDGREALANAVGPDQIEEQLAGVNDLLARIVAATSATEAHAEASERIAAQRAEGGRLLDAAGAIISTLTAPGTLPDQLAALRPDPGLTTDASGLEAAMGERASQAQTLLTTATAAPDLAVAETERTNLVGAADTALGKLLIAIGTVTEPALAKPLTDEEAALRLRRDALPSAAGLDDIRSATATEAGLPGEIDAVAAACVPAAAAARQVAADRAEATRLLDAAKSIIDTLATPGALTAELATLRTDPTTGFDASGIEAAAQSWPLSAQQLLDDAEAARDLEAAAVERTAKRQEVDNALQYMDDAIALITAPVACGPDTATRLALEQRCDDLADASDLTTIQGELAGVPQLLLDIGAAETEATNAQAEWTLLEARQLACDNQLATLAAKLSGVTDTAKVAVETEITDAQAEMAKIPACSDLAAIDILIGTVEPLIDPLRAKAFGLIGNSLKAEAAVQLTKVATLAVDYAKVAPSHPLSAEVARLESLRLAAEAQTDPQDRMTKFKGLVDEAKAVHSKADMAQRWRVAAEGRLKSAKGWINIVPSGSAGTLVADHARLVSELTAHGSLASLPDFDTRVRALHASAVQLSDDAIAAAAPDYSDKQMKNLGVLVARFGKIAEPNAVKNLQTRLMADQAGAASLTGKPRADALKAVGLAAVAAWPEAQKALEVKAGIGKRLYALEQVPFKALNVNDSNPLEIERKRILSRFAAECGATDEDVAAVTTRFQALETAVTALEKKTDDAQAAKLNIRNKTSEIKKSMTTMDGVIADLAAVPEKAELERLSAEAKAKLAGFPATFLADLAGYKKALFAFGREVEALMRRASKAVFTDILAQPGGTTMVDAMVKGMGETTNDMVAQELCRAAMEARFGLTIDIPEGMSVERLPTLYAMFAKVPAGHVGHDKLCKLEYETDPDSKSSYYNKGDSKEKSKIVLNKIGGGSDLYPMQSQGPGREVEEVNFFKATTLHEIGHAVDEKNSVMKFNDDAYGGWRKESIPTVAKALCDSFFTAFIGTGKATEADMLEAIALLLGMKPVAKPASATAKLGSLFGQWDAIIASPGWANCAKVRDSDKSPWDNPVVCSDGYAYHEAYAGDWVRYNHSERSKGVSNYQWRAPGEWFAEWYAYHYMLDKPVPACVEAAITT